MEEKDRTLGLRSVVSISVGLVIATSCLVSLGQGAGSIGVVFIGAMVIACLLNMTTVASLSELNARCQIPQEVWLNILWPVARGFFRH